MKGEALAHVFADRFGARPTLKVWAPGRVNLIGEHIDYAGLPVLPMAIQRGLTLVVRPRQDSTIRVVAARSDRGERTFDVGRSSEPGPAGDWGNYPKAALRGLMDAGQRPGGFDAVLGSDLPVAAGLSSSSALVVATALAALAAGSGPDVDSLRLAELLAAAEHYVGARGGGMDQAAILLGRAGHALRIDFAPLAVRPVRIPHDWTFVVAHSLEEAEKSGAAREAYNERRTAVEQSFAALGGTPRELLARRGGTSLLRTAAAELSRDAARRVRHVVTESGRVGEAVAALEADDAPRFGSLMLASHASLRDDFEVSTEALDDLVRMAVAAGALGARLTGAGLGGCVVALIPAGTTDAFRADIRSSFYEPRGVSSTDGLLFAVRPAEGARTAGI